MQYPVSQLLSLLRWGENNVDSHAEHRSMHTASLLSENVLYTSNLPYRSDWKLTLLMIQHRDIFCLRLSRATYKDNPPK